METWNIYELLIWLDKCVDRIHTQIFIEIRNVINDTVSSSRYWSNCVDKVWDENCEHAINLSFTLELIDVDQKKYNLAW